MAAISSNKYGKLNQFSQHILQIFAIIPGQLNKDLVKKLIKATGRLDNGKNQTVDSAFTKLIQSGLIINTRYGLHHIAPDAQDFAMQAAIRCGSFDQIVAAINNSEESYYPSNASPGGSKRRAFYENDVKSFRAELRLKQNADVGVMTVFDRDIFDSRDPLLQQLYLADALPRVIDQPAGDDGPLIAMEAILDSQVPFEDDFLGASLDIAIARGDFEALEKLDQLTGNKLPEISGSVAMLRGDYKQARIALNAAVGGKKKSKLSPTVRLPALFYLALLFKDGSGESNKQSETLVRSARRSTKLQYRTALDAVETAIAFHRSSLTPKQFIADLQSGATTQLGCLMAGYLANWLLTKEDTSRSIGGFVAAANGYRKLGLDWLSAEMSGLAGRSPTLKTAAASLDASTQDHNRLGTASLIDLLSPEPAWHRALGAIARLGSGAPPTAETTQQNERLIWEWDGKASDSYINMAVFHQKLKGKTWSKGRKIALTRLFEQAGQKEFSFLSDQDRRLVSTLELHNERNHYGYEEAYCSFNDERAARAMVGHPCIVPPGDRDNPFEIVEQPPKLVVTKTNSGCIRIKLDPLPKFEDNSFGKTLDGPRRVVFSFFSDEHHQIKSIIGKFLDVPMSAAGDVLASLGNVAKLVTVHSEIGDAPAAKKGRGKSSDQTTTITAAKKVKANPCTHAHLLPHQDGLRIEFYVQPFGDAGPFCPVGQGATNVIANIDGRPLSTMRKLKDESKRLSEVLAACPEIASRIDRESSIALPSPLEALEALVELEDVVARKQLVIHWPKGRSFNVAGHAAAAQFNIQIRKERDWFAASGNLKIDKSLSLDLMQLVDMVGARPGRFVQLDDGRFIALTQQLRQRIDELAAYGNRSSQKNNLRFARVHAPVLEELCDSVKLKSDKHWKDWTQRMRDAESVSPEVPTTLQAELRDYQVEGFQWLARLAAWGVGGCLADDMGLGKTMQAIALLLHRGGDGPALIVAPTSVASNWLSEINRFAPTLNARLFGDGDRDALLADLGPRDVVICSYGLLHTESERLQSRPWHTLVLDEAQAIKNMATLRSQAAMKLDADFRVILTGTPMENHLGELWNLMEFINPGLLGSHDDFQNRFAMPIETQGCHDTRRRLKKLIHPFILRRTKSQVLQELPSRTEVTLNVTLSTEEAAFYEALRQRAVEQLADAAEGNRQHFQILAEIMRLRRACCHPRLVLEDSPISGSKLELFSKTIDELITNKHKVLVFSQFVDHLSILRDELESKGVSYQYLDGSTPAKKRKQSVDAFQGGDGDVFLISLKAGGLGLNLTAADYVIHMDPWWNPAVEDQASDRAHRMGQKRPVTIYRLITEGTIEQRITDLHATKRDLADSLLEGTEISAKLSAEDLLKMIRS